MEGGARTLAVLLVLSSILLPLASASLRLEELARLFSFGNAFRNGDTSRSNGGGGDDHSSLDTRGNELAHSTGFNFDPDSGNNPAAGLPELPPINNPGSGNDPGGRFPQLPLNNAGAQTGGKNNDNGNENGNANPISTQIPSQQEVAGNGLRLNFYQNICPQAEKIVNEIMTQTFRTNPGIAANLARLHFHDCFVRGCDASILLDKNPGNEDTEKVAPENIGTLKGFEIIDQIKTRLENECPGIVSCADIMSFAVRDGYNLTGVPRFELAGGRRDSLTGKKIDCLNQLPSPNWKVDQMMELFTRKGFTTDELVTLIGAHSIGQAHCSTFNYRIRLPNAAQTLDPRLFQDIQFTCRANQNTMLFDTVTPFSMDTTYFKQSLNNKALLESDQNLANDPRTHGIMLLDAVDQNRWLNKFATAMVKLSNLEALTGNQGQIRKQCRVPN